MIAQILTSNTDLDIFIMTATILQLIISAIVLVKNNLREQLINFQYFVIAQQIIWKPSYFAFTFLIVSSMIYKDLNMIESPQGRYIKVLLCLTETSRMFLEWNGETMRSIEWIGSIIAVFLIFINQEFIKRKQSINSSTQNKEECINIVPMISQLSVIQFSQKIDSEFSILESIPLGVILIDQKYSLKFANIISRQYFSHFDCENDSEIVTQLQSQLAKLLLNCSDEDQPKIRKRLSSLRIDDPLREILENSRDEQIQLIHKYKETNLDGITKVKTVKFFIDKKSVKSEVLIVVLIENVSSKQKRKELTQFINFQNQIINSFSHELKTPLNCSLQILEVLTAKLSNQLNLDYIQPALNSNRLLLLQIEDILDYASIQSGQFSFKYEELNLKEITELILRLYTASCETKRIKIISKFKLLNPLITNDEQRIMQVLVNLINNSIKFSPSDTRIKIQFKQKQKSDRSFIKVKVKDQGYGIQSQKLAQLFKELHSVTSDESSYWATQTQLSMGIGLKISNRLIRGLVKDDKLNDMFHIKTELKKFTNFSFYIEDMKSDVSEQIQSSDYIRDELFTVNLHKSLHYKLIENIGNHKCDCSSVLIVDDVPFNIQALKLMLQQHNIKTDQAYNGIEALDRIINRFSNKKCHPQYELIIMDIEMPMMNGIQATQKIIQFFKSINLEPPTIIVSSAYDNKIENLKMFADALPKPITQQALQVMLTKYPIILN